MAFLLRDGMIKSPDTVAIYCGIAFFTSLLVFQWFQTSSPIHRYFSLRDGLELLKACVLVAALSAVLAFLLTRLDAAPRSIPVLHFIALATGLSAARLVARLRETRRQTRAHDAMKPVRNVLIIEASRLTWFFSKMLEELAPGECQIVAILDERPELQNKTLNGYPIVGPPANIGRIIDEYAVHGIRIDKVIVAKRREDFSVRIWQDIGRVCADHKIALEALPEQLIPGLFLETAAPYADALAPPAAASLGDLDAQLARPFWKIKRVIDCAIAASIFILISPITLCVLCIVFLDVGAPVIFWQRRVGRNGSALHLYKFRTLQILLKSDSDLPCKAPQVSTVGRFLQKFRLDELPQLWNVLFGDMSLIGPRPLLPADQPQEPSIRLTVRPGVSGWAQICGGKLISPEEKNALDEWYIRHASLRLDIIIVLRTIATLFVGDRRDDKAISIALGEKLRAHFVDLSDPERKARSDGVDGRQYDADLALADASLSDSTLLVPAGSEGSSTRALG